MKGNNCLHYAMLSDCLPLIERLVCIDSDYQKMRNHQNLQGKTP